MKRALSLFLLLALAAPSVAQPPGPDVVGFYFDESAVSSHLVTPLLYQPNDCYLVLCNPSGNGLLGWDCYPHLDPLESFSSVTQWCLAEPS